MRVPETTTGAIRATAGPAVAARLAPALKRSRRSFGEAFTMVVLMLCGVLSIATTVGIIVVLADETVAFFQAVPIGDYLTGTQWSPTFQPASFGVVPLLSATMLISAIAAVVAVPLSLGVAIYLSEYASRRARDVIKPALELLAGIPTVVFGYFALTFITPHVLQPLIPGTPVFNALSAGIAVGIMIVPLIASISEDSLRAVPRSLREAAFGLGATRHRTAIRVVLPAAFSGVSAATLLGLSRAIGETMVVTIAAGAIPNLAIDPREAMQTITAFIVQVSLGDTPATSIAYKTIFALGATLFVITFVLNMLAGRIVRRYRERYE